MVDASSVAVLVLGAGAGSRYAGADKLGTMLGDRPVAHHILQVLNGFSWGERIVTCRSFAPWTQAYADAGFTLALTEDVDTGMLGSLHRGLAEIQQERVLICLADMPLVPRSHIEELLRASGMSHAPVVASSSGIYQGPPALCSAEHLRALPLAGEGGARSLLSQADFVPMNASAIADIDTVHDYENVRQILQRTSPE
ncbi:NTP transferase domain-containing protein [Pseudochrobactrum sp. sp1633]|uniref:nucleotidyltransferase family protein n=1 Tax=Pseudochrobactrum sp. sp1633 TaxID=3036706 RepID=UPI0025A61556|nr:NTP transferase domain-containing protein [Pseudochrobactrum sp. sp1633]MDM8345889.1 NTP transferase domain-containing protein [Pseudochrobactrum sp. sp1633]HWD12254.1 NTP transferase domain-containing protein [Pseudochrobactrum sp.]